MRTDRRKDTRDRPTSKRTGTRPALDQPLTRVAATEQHGRENQPGKQGQRPRAEGSKHTPRREHGDRDQQNPGREPNGLAP